MASTRSSLPTLPKGLVIVNTGNGKGKTTAALGLALRAWGQGLRLIIFQFIKSKDRETGELKAAKKIGIEMIPIGEGRFIRDKVHPEERKKAIEGWQRVQDIIIHGEYDLLILDEFTYLFHLAILDVNEVIHWLQINKPAQLHIVITGRYAPQELIDFADLVTEMNEIKHPWTEKKIKAQAGIEY